MLKINDYRSSERILLKNVDRDDVFELHGDIFIRLCDIHGRSFNFSTLGTVALPHNTLVAPMNAELVVNERKTETPKPKKSRCRTEEVLRGTKEIRFGELCEGDAFEYNNAVFIKTVQSSTNALNLTMLRIEFVQTNTYVIPLEVELVLSGKGSN